MALVFKIQYPLYTIMSIIELEIDDDVSSMIEGGAQLRGPVPVPGRARGARVRRLWRQPHRHLRRGAVHRQHAPQVRRPGQREGLLCYQGRSSVMFFNL